MRFRLLFVCCNNLTLDSRVRILEYGHPSYTSVFRKIFTEVIERKVEWFSVEDGLICIKLLKE